MILVLSQNDMEESTIDVIKWIVHLGGNYARLNGSDLEYALSQKITLNQEGLSIEFQNHPKSIDFDNVNITWFRRWHSYRDFKYLDLKKYEIEDSKINSQIYREFQALTNNFSSLLKNSKWLSHFNTSTANKLDVLYQAVSVGLSIPSTLVTNSKKELEKFKKEQINIITKAIGEVTTFRLNKKIFGLYTSQVTDQDIENLPEQFFSSLFQKNIKKQYELRVFYLDEICYSMAIFSQSNKRTKTDFRFYDQEHPNRSVPYQLPIEIEGKIIQLMNKLNLKTGSVDLMKGLDGEYYFIEVNPIGQFGMVSKPCNYFLEEKMAQYLINKDCEHEA